jgi:hypothetical protein
MIRNEISRLLSEVACQGAERPKEEKKQREIEG